MDTFTLILEVKANGELVSRQTRVSHAPRDLAYDLAWVLEHDIPRPDCILAEAILCLAESAPPETRLFCAEAQALYDAALAFLRAYREHDDKEASQ